MVPILAFLARVGASPRVFRNSSPEIREPGHSRYRTIASPNSWIPELHKTGAATVVFHVRSANPANVVRTYTVESGKRLEDTWNAAPSYHLSVYGPNGFLHSFHGNIAAGAAVLHVVSKYGTHSHGSITLLITNLANVPAEVSVLDAYTGKSDARVLRPYQGFADTFQLDRFGGWYDVIVKVSGDASFRYQVAGHIETGNESISDPALGGLLTLQD